MENTSIVVCGQKFDIGTRVVLWDEPNGLNAYRENTSVLVGEDRHTGKQIKKTITGKRYSKRTFLKTNNLESLQNKVTQFFLHHSGLYHSKTTFAVLHNERKLSVHFILDDNGTLYQTLDLAECAWHAGKNNSCSVGIEIDSRALAIKFPNAYDIYNQKKYIVSPREKKVDRIHNSWVVGFDYTDKQYSALIKLSIKLCELFPKLNNQLVDGKMVADFPRDNKGRIVKGVIPQPTKHCGFICHYNTSENKLDPISFDHNRFLLGIRMEDPSLRLLTDFSSLAVKQKALIELGYFSKQHAYGNNGQKTLEAIKLFQKDNNIKETGWGARTEYCIWWCLNNMSKQFDFQV